MKLLLKKKLVHAAKRLIRPLLAKYSAKQHLSGNGFMNLCDYYLSKDFVQIEDKIANINSIFVKSDLANEFFLEFGNLLVGKTVIVGNGDTNFDVEYPHFHIPRTVFLQNMGFEPTSKNIRLLPIGLENFEHVRSGFGFLHKPPRDHSVLDKILVPPMSPTNSIRQQVIGDLKSADPTLFQVETKMRSVISYLRLTKKFKFVLVCEGNGHDTHRLWEVLYQNSFPVMLNTAFSRNVRNIGLPVLVVDSILDLTKIKLEKHMKEYGQISANSIKELWLTYWRAEILGPGVKTN